MSDLYIIVLELDEDSVYFTEMTRGEATAMSRALTRTGHKFTMSQIRMADGFSDYPELLETIKDMGAQF